MYRLIDTHAHLEEIPHLEQVIAAARAAGLVGIIGVGSDYESNEQVLDLARTYPGFVYPAIGWHPWNLDAAAIDRHLEFIEAHIKAVVGVGEVGLDYHKKVRAVADKDLQQRVLRELLRIAGAHRKPAIIHSRYAWRDALTLVEEAGLEKVVFHWYTGTSSVLRDIISRGYFISATPAVVYHEEHRRAVKEVPLDRLLLETDSPVTYGRGSEFEYQARPVDVLKSLEGVARLRNMSPEQVAAATTENAQRLFGLPS